MDSKFRRRAVCFSAIGALAAVLIAIGLPELSFLPGIPPPRGPEPSLESPQPHEAASAVFSVSAIGKLIVLVVLATLLVFLLLRILSHKPWKSLSKILMPMFWSVVVFTSVGGLLMLIPRGPMEPLVAAPVQPPVRLKSSPLGPTPLAVILGVGILLVLALALGALWIFKKPKPTASPLQFVGLHAEEAKKALLDGGTLKDVIIRCYLLMASVFQSQQGLQRSDEMTTKEFERLLTDSGAPPEPVHQLTQLFEMVRYGREEPAVQDEHRALECLQALGDYCRRSGPAQP